VPTDTAYDALADAMRAGEMILIAREEEDETVETATALITSMSSAMPDQAESTISISLTIDGEWTAVGS